MEETKALIPYRLILLNPIAPTPPSRVELPQIETHEASSSIHLKVPACDLEIFNGGEQ